MRGGKRPVPLQIAHAFEKFFPGESGASDKPSPSRPSVSSRRDSRLQPPPLQRVDTGLSSIVGSDNGDLPGGVVLVVDGAALLQVSRH